MTTAEDNWPAILRQSIREDWHLTDEAKEQLAAHMEKAIIADEHRMAALIVKALRENEPKRESNWVGIEGDVVRLDGRWNMVDIARAVIKGMLVDLPPKP